MANNLYSDNQINHSYLFPRNTTSSLPSATNTTNGQYLNDSDYVNYLSDSFKYDGTVGIFIATKTKSGKMYIILNSFFLIYYLVPLFWILKYRNWYIFKQRNFLLTFIGLIANFISTMSNSLTPIMQMPCSFAYYSATIATSIMQLCYIFRAFRLILLYKLNIFKVTNLKQDKFIKKSKGNTLVEPNIYFKSMYKMVNKKIAYITIFTIEIIVVLVSVGAHIITRIKYGSVCGLRFVNINGRINGETYGMDYIKEKNIKSANEVPEDVSTFSMMHSMFIIPDILTVIFIIVCLCITIIFTFTKIKDNKRFGIKFDCFSTALISIFVGIIYFIFKYNNEKYLVAPEEVRSKLGLKEMLTSHKMYLRTKQGIILFVFVGLYIQLSSVIIPLIQCIYSEYMNKKYENEPLNEIEHFQKILRSPDMVEELKAVAVQEFCVENVLFWENYCLLHSLFEEIVKRENELGEGEDSANQLLLQNIINDSYTFSSSLQDSRSYTSDRPVSPQLLPYFNTFYYTFIDMDGPSPVNISSEVLSKINYEINTYPTAGIFDEAKDEVVELMFFTIFPIFLQDHRKQLGKLYSSNV